MIRLSILLLILVGTGLVLWIGPANLVELPMFDRDALEQTVRQAGVWAPLLIIALRAGAGVMGVVPSSPVVLAAGAICGVVWGTIYVMIGAELGALIGFFMARYLGRDYVQSHGWFQAVKSNRFGEWLLVGDSSQWRLTGAVVLCRLVPGINLDATSYVAGVTQIAAWRFALATLAGLLPYTLALVWAGARLAEGQILEAFAVLAALLLLGMLPFILRAVGTTNQR